MRKRETGERGRDGRGGVGERGGERGGGQGWDLVYMYTCTSIWTVLYIRLVEKR